MPTKPDIHIAHDSQEWAQKAATLVHTASEDAIRSHGRCLIALSGGTTPRTLYETLTAPDWRERFDWSRIFFLFGDERCVPPDHPGSNFATAHSSLFQPLGIAPDHIYRMKGEIPDPLDTAKEYEEVLRRLTHCAEPDIPRIDIILLGLGEDGHTASLFPKTEALHEQTRAVTVGHAPTGIFHRVTLSLGVLNQATVVLFLVSGPSKASVVRRILDPQNPSDRSLPAAMVSPEAGRLIWMLDHSAAAQLTIQRINIRSDTQT